MPWDPEVAPCESGAGLIPLGELAATEVQMEEVSGPSVPPSDDFTIL